MDQCWQEGLTAGAGTLGTSHKALPLLAVRVYHQHQPSARFQCAKESTLSHWAVSDIAGSTAIFLGDKEGGTAAASTAGS